MVLVRVAAEAGERVSTRPEPSADADFERTVLSPARAASKLIEQYLALEASEVTKSDDEFLNAYKLGGALSMLAHLLGVHPHPTPDIVRAMFDKWRAEQAPESSNDMGVKR